MKPFKNRQSEEAKVDLHPRKRPEMSKIQKFLGGYPPPLNILLKCIYKYTVWKEMLATRFLKEKFNC